MNDLTKMDLDLSKLSEEELYAAVDRLRKLRLSSIERTQETFARKAIRSRGGRPATKRDVLRETAIQLLEAAGKEVTEELVEKLKAKLGAKVKG